MRLYLSDIGMKELWTIYVADFMLHGVCFGEAVCLSRVKVQQSDIGLKELWTVVELFSCCMVSVFARLFVCPELSCIRQI
jgi:hypothetical protein